MLIFASLIRPAIAVLLIIIIFMSIYYCLHANKYRDVKTYDISYDLFRKRFMYTLFSFASIIIIISIFLMFADIRREKTESYVPPIWHLN